MTVHLQRYRTEFPVTESFLYLNHPTVCPLPRRVRDAMSGLVEDAHRSGVEHWDRWLEAYETARSTAARLLNADAGEIAFVKNTSEAISFVANGLDWQWGDEVVSVETEFVRATPGSRRPRGPVETPPLAGDSSPSQKVTDTP